MPEPAVPAPHLADRRPVSEDELRARIAATPVEGTPARMRAAFSALMGPPPDRLARSKIGGVPVVRVGSGPRRALWLHGGGYVFGGPETHAHAGAALADRLDATIWLPDYPLAPEAPWPAQLEAAQAVLDGIDGPVTVVGDSAGGHLALRLALAKPGRISALSLMSPNTDRSGSSTTRHCDTDAMNDDATDTRLARMAFGDRPGSAPELSPLLDDLSALPPTQILVASAEILLDDALLLARAIGLAHGSVDLRVWPGLFHLWGLWPEALPQARAALDAMADHLRRATPLPTEHTL